MFVPPESSSAVLVMIRSKSVSICNHSRVTLVNSSRNHTFSRGTQIWCARTEDSLNLGSQTLHRWNLRLMPMLVPPESSSAVLVMISRKYVSICNRSHTRRANSGKITIFYRGTPLWCTHSRRISSPSGTKLPHCKLETLGYHTVETLVSIWPGLDSDRQTDRRTDRQT